MPCCGWKCVPIAISGVDISEVPGCHLSRHVSFQWGSQKLLQGFVSHELTVQLSVFDLFLTQSIMAILSKGCKPDNFESHYPLKLNFTNIRGLCLNFVDCQSFLDQTLLTFLLYGRLTWMINWFWQFLCEGLSSFNPKGFYYSHIHGLAVYLKEGLLHGTYL